MRIAYACSWWRPVETTWSGISAGLMNPLAANPNVDLIRVDAQHGFLTSAALAAFGRARGYGTWTYSRPNRALTEAKVRRKLHGLDVDAVIGVADIDTIAEVPTFLFKDASLSTTLAHRDFFAEHAPALVKFPRGRLEDLVVEQREAYASAACVFTFSQWFADWLVEHDGVSRDRVCAVGGGFDTAPAPRRLEARGAGGTRVLFIGREFFRKGGDLVVSAIDRLRTTGAGEFTLSVVGPAEWPLPGAIPDWVDFRGEVPSAEVRRLWADHDIFALPTWYEPYGLVFLEARAAGVPILGRAAYAMPEIIPETAGRLIPAEGGVDEVAEELLAMSTDEALFKAAAADSDRMSVEGTWAKVADRVADRIEKSIA